MRLILRCLCLACSLVHAATSLPAGVFKIELPPETDAFKPGPGSEIANAQCLICHSVEYVSTQPPMPRTFWAAEVEKMRDKYGAPVPKDQIEPLVNYLASTYRAGTNGVHAATPVMSTRPSPVSTSAQATTGEAVATKYGCLGCHNVETKIVGPSYKDIATKYRQSPDALAKVTEQIHKGGSGKWGSVIMPPFPTVSDKETQLLADWILSRK